jgi:hypothetical protein
VLSVEDPVRFAAPGAASVEVVEPRAYLLWHDYRTVFGDRSYRSEPDLPGGAKITVLGPDSAPVALEPETGQTWSGAEGDRKAFSRFQARAPGRYSVAVAGDIPPLVISVSPDTFGRRWR